MKVCRTCEKELPLSEYHKDRTRADGHKYVCKKCSNKRNREKYKKDPTPHLEAVRRYRENNRERDLELARKRRRENPERHRDYMRQWRKDNPEKVKKMRKKNYQNNKEYYREYLKEYRKDDKVRLIHNLRVRIPRFVRRGGVSESTKKLLGCNLDKLKDHLESQFEDGMSWDNYGEWEIDHIVPVSSLKESDNLKEEAKEVFHYTNLQPLWAYENKSKGNRMNYAN